MSYLEIVTAVGIACYAAVALILIGYALHRIRAIREGRR